MQYMLIVYSIILYLYIQLYFLFCSLKKKKDHCYQFGFLETPCIKWDADTENILYIVNSN